MTEQMKILITNKEMLRPFLCIFHGKSLVPLSKLDIIIKKSYELIDSDSINSIETFLKNLDFKMCVNDHICECKRSDLEETAGLKYISEKEFMLLKEIWKKIVYQVIINHDINGNLKISLTKGRLKRIYPNTKLRERINYFIDLINSFKFYEGFSIEQTSFKKNLFSVTFNIKY